MTKPAHILTAAVLALAASAARAAPVELSASPYAPARKVVDVVFANYLPALTGAQVASGLTDLDSDGKAEVVARFVHSSSCREGMKSCRTVVLRHMRGDWRIVIDRFARTLEVAGSGYKYVPSPVVIDGDAWEWNGDRYLPDVSSMGEAVEFSPVPARSAAAYAAAFGERAARLSEGFGVTYSYSKDGYSSAGDVMVVKMEGDVACGEIAGCPVRVMRKAGEAWKTVLAAATTGEVRLSKTVRDGYRDLLIETKDGALQYGWTGSGYAVADRIEGVTQ